MQERCRQRVADIARSGATSHVFSVLFWWHTGCNCQPAVTLPPTSQEDLLEILSVWQMRLGFDTAATRISKPMVESQDYRHLARRVASILWADPGEQQVELARARREAERALRAAEQPGIDVIPICDPRYPQTLMTIADPPLVLWARGQLDALLPDCVGIVGSRDATPASLALARKLGRELSEAGVNVVSGLAKGVDGSAHVGALDGPGQTIAVMGSGLSHVYPARHHKLAERIESQGVVVTEYPPWFLPYGRHFPPRNRIISGLSKGVVVVEASEDSGSLITARLAADQNRDVHGSAGRTALRSSSRMPRSHKGWCSIGRDCGRHP